MTTLSRDTELMWQVGIEGDLFDYHERTSVCSRCGCVPVANDLKTDRWGTFRQWWLCNPWPNKTHLGYIVLRDEWSEDLSVRVIYEWRAWTAHDQAEYDRMLQDLVVSKKESRD